MQYNIQYTIQHSTCNTRHTEDIFFVVYQSISFVIQCLNSPRPESMTIYLDSWNDIYKQTACFMITQQINNHHTVSSLGHILRTQWIPLGWLRAQPWIDSVQSSLHTVFRSCLHCIVLFAISDVLHRPLYYLLYVDWSSELHAYTSRDTDGHGSVFHRLFPSISHFREMFYQYCLLNLIVSGTSLGWLARVEIPARCTCIKTRPCIDYQSS